MTHAEAGPLAEVAIRAAADGRYVLYWSGPGTTATT